MNHDFYIGYLPKGPKRNMRFILGVVIFTFVASFFFGWIISMRQDKVNNGSYEYGNLTELEGVISKYYPPTLTVYSQHDSTIHKSILLIDFGKFGASSSIEKMEQRIGGNIENYHVKIRGTLIYNDGVTMLELTEKENSLLSFEAYNQPQGDWKVYGLPPRKKLIGEIVDSKCYFGSMKPGNNKPHRSCAALCISGGIPPVFVVSNKDGSANYYLFQTDGEDQSNLISQILPFVGERIEIESRFSDPNRFEGMQFGYVGSILEIKRLD